MHHFSNGMEIKTTLGQLNFFKWAFTHGIVDFVEKNLKQISKEIKTLNKKSDKKETNKKSKSSGEKKSVKSRRNKMENNISSIKINNNKGQKDETHLTLTFD